MPSHATYWMESGRGTHGPVLRPWWHRTVCPQSSLCACMCLTFTTTCTPWLCYIYSQSQCVTKDCGFLGQYEYRCEVALVISMVCYTVGTKSVKVMCIPFCTTTIKSVCVCVCVCVCLRMPQSSLSCCAVGSQSKTSGEKVVLFSMYRNDCSC